MRDPVRLIGGVLLNGLLTGLAASTFGAALLGATCAPALAATDEDQVRAVLNGMNGSYNRSDFSSFVDHVCTTMRDAAGFEAQWYQSRRADGPTRITVNSVSVSGADAVATVQFSAKNRPGPKTFDVDFLREGSQWKACEYHAARTA